MDESVIIGAEAPELIVSLDEALRRLAVVDSRKSDIVPCLYVGGMTYDETAAALNISAATVDRELRMAKACFTASWQRDQRKMQWHEISSRSRTLG